MFSSQKRNPPDSQVSRSASFVVGYVMQHERLSFSEAHSVVRSIRPVVSISVSSNPNFLLTYLIAYQPAL